MKVQPGQHMLVVYGAGRPFKPLQDRFLAKLKARRSIICVTYYMTLKTRFSFKEHMKSNTRLLAPGPTGAKDGFAG